MKTNLEINIIESLKNYKGISALRKEAMSVLIKMLSSKEIENLRQSFSIIDKDETGMINFEEL